MTELKDRKDQDRLYVGVPDVLSDEECIAFGTASTEIIEFFKDIYPCGPNVLICGESNSGKTVQLERIPLCLNPMTRIVTIEDNEEMTLEHKISYQNYPNIVSHIETEYENKEKRLDIGHLLKTSLSENPDLIIIGETKDPYMARQIQEAYNAQYAVATSVHASSAKKGAQRMMQLAGNDAIAAAQVTSTWDLIIYLANDNGTRRIMEICELISFDGEEPITNTIFEFNQDESRHVFVNKMKTMRDKLINKNASETVVERWCTS